MSTKLTRERLSTLFSHFIEKWGTPIHHFADVVESLAILATLSSMLHPTHAFELCHAALFFANLNLVVQLHRYHRTQQD